MEYAAAGEGRRNRGFPVLLSLVVADAGRMEQVLSNLLSNAVKSSNVEGKIIVFGRRKGDRVEITVGDRGARIDPSPLEKIFERFTRWMRPLAGTIQVWGWARSSAGNWWKRMGDASWTRTGLEVVRFLYSR